MKKRFLLLAVSSLSMYFYACDKNDSNPTPSTTATTPTTTTKEFRNIWLLVNETNNPKHYLYRPFDGSKQEFDGGFAKSNLYTTTESGRFGVSINVANASPHHGAMAMFDNGYYAVTQDDNSVTGFSASLPERVNIIHPSDGSIVHASTLATKGIHGEAGDGKIVLFGSYSGVLVVKEDGSQRLIPNPSTFGSTDILGTLFYAEGVSKFYGRSSKKGIYKIDTLQDAITPLLESTDIMAVSLSNDQKKMAVLLLSGEAILINMVTDGIERRGNVIPAVSSAETSKPVILSSQRYLYITQPLSGEIWQVSTADFGNIQKIKLGEQLHRMTMLGAETDR